jgi:hypothetical protein
MLAGYFVLLGLHFYLQFLQLRREAPHQAGRYFLYFWVSGLLGFLTHQSAVVYMAPLVLHAAVLALFRRPYRPTLAEMGMLMLSFVLIVEPWFAWLAGNMGMEKILHGTPTTARTASTQFTLPNMVYWVGANLWTSLAPVELYEAFVDGLPTFKELYRAMTGFYFCLFPGALTLSLTLFLICAFFKWLGREAQSLWQGGRAGFRHEDATGDSSSVSTPPEPRAGRQEWLAVVLFLILGTLGAAVVHPETVIHGIAHAACFPTAILLAALGWGLLSRARRQWAALVVAGMVAEFLVMFWSHWWLLVTWPEILERLPGNADYKMDADGNQVVFFLNERLGSGQYVFLAGAVLIQVVLCLLLARHVWGNRDGKIAAKPAD